MGKRAFGLMVAVMAAGGCRTYEPQPLEPGAHGAVFAERSVQSVLGDEAASPGEGLTLVQAKRVAFATHPRVRRWAALVGRETLAALEEGRLDDLRLQATLLDSDADVADSWMASLGLGVTIPLGGRLGAARAAGWARQAAASARMVEEMWQVGFDLELAWRERAGVALRLSAIEGVRAELSGFRERAAELERMGELSGLEARLFAIEAERLASAAVRWSGELRAADQRVLAAMGLPPVAEAKFSDELGGGQRNSVPGVRMSHPRLVRLEREYAVAEAALRLEIARSRPDLRIGPQVEQEEGTFRIGLFGGLPIPIWNRNRVAIAFAEGQRTAARVAYETALEELVGRFAALSERRVALERGLARFSAGVSPLLDQQRDEAAKRVALGEAGGLALLTAWTRGLEVELEGIELRLERARVEAELIYLGGPDPDGLAGEWFAGGPDELP